MIFITGAGRSGTSDVARILVELGVNMGERFDPPDEFNPQGYFEDRDFQDLNMMFCVIGLHENSPKELWEMWRERFNTMVASKKEPWGLKDPGVADFPSLLNEYLKLNPRIILCTRNREDTINSFGRQRGTIRKKAERIYDNRTDTLTTQLSGKEYLEVDCYDTNKAEKIKMWYNNI